MPTTASNGCPPEVRAAFRGLCPSVTTPFARRGEIDVDGLRKLLDFMIDAKAKVVVLTLGDSLFTLLTDDEVAEVTKAVCRHVGKRALVVAATKPWWTGKAVEFATLSARLGAAMLMVLPPDWAASCTVDSLVAHYRAVSQEIPVMLVDNYLADRPLPFAVELIPLPFAVELITRLRDEVPGVIAMKDDVGEQLGRRIGLLTRDRWALMASGEELHMNDYPYGVDGWMSSISIYLDVKLKVASRYWSAMEAGNLKDASALVREYAMPVFEFLCTLAGGFDAGVHGLMEIYGLAGRYRRPPYHSLSDAEMQRLSGFLKKKGLL
jgi:4-hydroxy-tetrahydrodipicolinate synthase